MCEMYSGVSTPVVFAELFIWATCISPIFCRKHLVFKSHRSTRKKKLSLDEALTMIPATPDAEQQQLLSTIRSTSDDSDEVSEEREYVGVETPDNSYDGPRGMVLATPDFGESNDGPRGMVLATPDFDDSYDGPRGMALATPDFGRQGVSTGAARSPAGEISNIEQDPEESFETFHTAKMLTNSQQMEDMQAPIKEGTPGEIAPVGANSMNIITDQQTPSEPDPEATPRASSKTPRFAANPESITSGDDKISSRCIQMLFWFIALLLSVIFVLSVIIGVGGFDFMKSRSFDDRLVTQEGFARIPLALVQFIEDVVALPTGADGRRRLNLPPDMLEQLNGNCAYLQDYLPAQTSSYWQCRQNERNPNYPLLQDAEEGTPYQPSKEVLELLSDVTGASLSSLNKIAILSGQPKAPEGSWCGTPVAGLADAPNIQDHDQQQQKIAYDYWRKCVTPKSGYFNALQCHGLCEDPEDVSTCSTYAVLGYAALEPGVCYPAHRYNFESAYWQIAGHGWWRTWNPVEDLDIFTWASNDNVGGTRYAFHPHRSGTTIELDTTDRLDNDGGAGDLESPMVMIYWWGVDKSAPLEHQWEPEVREETFRYQESARTCGDTRRIPKYDDALPVPDVDC